MIDVENIRKAALYYVNNDVTLEYVIQNMKKINYFIKK